MWSLVFAHLKHILRHSPATLLHDQRVRTRSRTLRLTDVVGLGVGAAQTLFLLAQTAITLVLVEALGVAFFARETARSGGGEDDQLHTSGVLLVLQTAGVRQAWDREKHGK